MWWHGRTIAVHIELVMPSWWEHSSQRQACPRANAACQQRRTTGRWGFTRTGLRKALE